MENNGQTILNYLNILRPANLFILLKDVLGIKGKALDNKTHLLSALSWLKEAQDITGDGGVSKYYSLITGWQPSYVETTGYIIPTFINCYHYFGDKDLLKRAVKMAEFLLDHQLPDGGYRSKSKKEARVSEPVIFDTGQDIIGMMAIYQETKKKKYLKSASKAANFLISIQEKNGSWIKYNYGGVPHAYDTRVAWALLEVWEKTNNLKYKKSAIKMLDWSIKQQHKNGWFNRLEFMPPNPKEPFTHAISYVLEGLIESYEVVKNKKYYIAAIKTMNKIISIYNRNNFLAGTYNHLWKTKVSYSCLTGNLQLAYVSLKIFKITKNNKYNKFASRILNEAKKIQTVEGGIKGSQPIYGDIVIREGYCRMALLNWASKYFIDVLLENDKINQIY